MDTPLVKILLIAAAIAITVGVTVLAWSIFNEGSADVSTDGAEEAISDVPGTRADGVRARVDNARACEALGSAHWYAGAEGEVPDRNIYRQDTGDEIPDTNNAAEYAHRVQDHPATQVDEGGPHCAAAADVRSSSTGLIKKIILCTDANKNPTSCFTTYQLKR